MSGRIIPLHGDLHEAAAELLPWYLTGRLDGEDAARFEAHLKVCPQCQADLAHERQLQAAMCNLPDDEIESADDGWAALRPQLTQRPGLGLRVMRQWRAGAPWLRWAVAAQFAALVIGGGAALWLLQSQHVAPAGAYHTLSSAPEAVTGNIVVVFRPDTSERDLRQTLRDIHARLVDGPTVADAYILHVAPAGRDQAVTALRQRHAIVLAEPVDAGEPR